MGWGEGLGVSPERVCRKDKIAGGWMGLLDGILLEG